MSAFLRVKTTAILLILFLLKLPAQNNGSFNGQKINFFFTRFVPFRCNELADLIDSICSKAHITGELHW